MNEINKMTYKEFINSILETRGRFECGNEYHERHHIKPKCMQGTNDKNNLIDLFAREHFEAHRLLALENPDNEKLVYAWWNMSHMNKAKQRNYEITAEEYEEAKLAFSKAISEEMKGRKFSDETLKKMKDTAKERFIIPENNPMYGKKHSEESKNKISEGNRNPSKETRRKMSNAKDKKAVICLTTGIIYESVREAERQTGVDSGSIVKCCQGKKKHKSAGKDPITGEKLIWEYYKGE